MKTDHLVNHTRDLMKKYNIVASKRFGQNFITEPKVLEDMVKASHLGKGENVLEVGPGLGTLTEYLSEAADKVYAVEVDSNLIPILEETLSDCRNIQIINQDIMKTDISDLMQDKPFRIIANLPYYITTPVIMSFLESRVPCRSITVMVQKEVGERMTADPGSKNYGALSLAVKYYTDPSVVRKVPAGCFFPVPKVDSVIVHMDVSSKKGYIVKDEKMLFSLIRGAFNQRRKTLINALSGYSDINISKETIAEAVSLIDAKPTVRGEELSLADFVMLSDILSA